LGDGGLDSDYSSVTFASPDDIFVKLNTRDPESKTNRIGRLLRGDGSKWSTADITPMAGVQRVFAIASQLYALGGAKKISEETHRSHDTPLLFRYENGTWRWIPLNPDIEPLYVWGADNHLFVTGTGRLPILYYDGKGNIEEPVPRLGDRKQDPKSKDKLDF
jgi:hypothetical protein